MAIKPGELVSMLRDRSPRWQGLTDGRDPEVNDAVRDGLVERRGKGFVLTRKGQALARCYAMDSPTDTSTEGE